MSDYRNNPEWRSNRDQIVKNSIRLYVIYAKIGWSRDLDKLPPEERRQHDELTQQTHSLFSRQVELEGTIKSLDEKSPTHQSYNEQPPARYTPVPSGDNRNGCDNPNGDCGRFGSDRATQTDWKNDDPSRFGYNRRSRLEAWEDCGPGSSRALPTARPAYED